MKSCKRVCFLLLLLALSACGQIPSPASEMATVVQDSTTETSSLLPTHTPLPPLTATYFVEKLSATPPPTTPILPTQTQLPAVLPKFPLDGYVMLFAKDGDLYFQDGENSPIKLTYVGGNSPEMLISDDNQKVILFREGPDANAIYSINTDGSNERIIVPNQSLPPRSYWKNTVAFVPNTHLLVYATYDCSEQAMDTRCAVDVSIVDVDTGVTKKLVSSYEHEPYNFDGNFKVSLDGSMITVYSAGKIDLYNINGNVIARNILPYTPSAPDSRLIFPVISWVNNSDEIVIGIPDQNFFTNAWGNLPTYSLWKYQVKTNTLDKLIMDPMPVIFPGLSHIFKVSPDGKWILYVGEDMKQYIGNLESGMSKAYGTILTNSEWSQNSIYFFDGNIFGSVDTPMIELTSFAKWVDSDHFISYIDIRNKIIGQIINEHIYYYDFPDKNGQILLLMKSK